MTLTLATAILNLVDNRTALAAFYMTQRGAMPEPGFLKKWIDEAITFLEENCEDVRERAVFRATSWQQQGDYDLEVEAVYVGKRVVRHGYTGTYRAHR